MKFNGLMVSTSNSEHFQLKKSKKEWTIQISGLGKKLDFNDPSLDQKRSLPTILTMNLDVF